MKTRNESTGTVREVLNKGVEFLRERKTGEPEILAERLLQGLLGCKRFELYLNGDRELAAVQVEKYFDFLRQRAEGIPSQYILGQAEFMDFTLKVGPAVLIPRPETELLAEKSIQNLWERHLGDVQAGILDVGTGSGNLAISLASYLPKASVCAVDISDEALEIARLNSMRHEVGHRIQFLKSDLFAAIPAGLKFDLIVSNPPYLSESDMREIAPEVGKEPRQALLAGPRGTECLERLAKEAGPFLKPAGRMFIEIGSAQGRAAGDLFASNGWDCRIFKDYNGLDRVVALAARQGPSV